MNYQDEINKLILKRMQQEDLEKTMRVALSKWKPTLSKWAPLYQELTTNGYISTTETNFTAFMTYGQLPPGAAKIQWLKSKKEAIDFADAFKRKLPILNACVESKGGKPFEDANRTNTAPKDPLPSILKKFIHLLEA